MLQLHFLIYQQDFLEENTIKKMHYLKNNIYFDIYNDSMLEINKQLIISKSKKVHSIYTGFNGPATGQVFEDFKKEFDLKINSLLKND